MKNIDSLLSPICEAIKETNSKSKQVVFNMYLANILEAKNYFTWEQITDYINNNTKTELAKKTYINMTERAKKRQKHAEQKDQKKNTNVIDKKTDEDRKQRGGVKGFFSNISESKKEIDHDPSATNEKFINKYL
ncbi:zinc transporter [Escherichia coli]|uniref:zinc transporter n=1 Tax=Escherichia coli TaxID=562 RepID=UPI00182262EE|nr:zinc transporter [Escherichia coli]EFA6039090.1 zinc transporter [Escherichia coli]MDZ4898160.1 zinc transporter [Escherichia coli]HDL6466243.1 zinc transporter [Escherichia coli]